MKIIRSVEHQTLGHGNFKLKRIRPGAKSGNANDLGLGPLGMFDHANAGPGMLVPMHEHRNDEILSYLRSGTLWHEDTHGGRLPMSQTHLAVMNSGTGISHEESIPVDGEPVEMLQIFIRPFEADLPPMFQSHQFHSGVNRDEWRLIAGPEESRAPLTVRSQTWVYDREVLEGSFGVSTESNLDSLLYVFSGSIHLEGMGTLGTSDSLLGAAGEEFPRMFATEKSALVLFRIDVKSKYSRAGTYSG